jgi:hypothetical protein
MRIFFLPLTTRQTLIYAQRISEGASREKMTIMQRLEQQAHTTWLRWGQSKSKWLSKPVAIGNDLLDRIDWEEYSLRSFHDPKILNADQVSFNFGWIKIGRFVSFILLGLKAVKSTGPLKI